MDSILGLYILKQDMKVSVFPDFKIESGRLAFWLAVIFVHRLWETRVRALLLSLSGCLLLWFYDYDRCRKF
jgi:hypothetical protein